MARDSSTSPVAEGDVIAGKYRVSRVIGVGGMGVVVAAVHVDLGQRVALKFLLPRVAHQPELVERFAREARASAQIHSEHVARVMDVGTLETGSPYMVMEYLDGEDLAHTLETSGALPIETAVGHVLQACEAIAEAHVLGIVHRDLKPANLFLSRKPNGSAIIKVLDFGISKSLTTADGSGLTKGAAIIGSPSYMPPEQIRSAKSVDVRADQWSLGVILYELIAGVKPFAAETIAELVYQITGGKYVKLRALRPEAPPELEAAIERCLQKNAADRFPDVAELAVTIAPYGPAWSVTSTQRISHVLGVRSAYRATAFPPARKPGGTPSHPEILDPPSELPPSTTANALAQPEFPAIPPLGPLPSAIGMSDGRPSIEPVPSTIPEAAPASGSSDRTTASPLSPAAISVPVSSLQGGPAPGDPPSSTPRSEAVPFSPPRAAPASEPPGVPAASDTGTTGAPWSQSFSGLPTAPAARDETRARMFVPVAIGVGSALAVAVVAIVGMHRLSQTAPSAEPVAVSVVSTGTAAPPTTGVPSATESGPPPPPAAAATVDPPVPAAAASGKPAPRPPEVSRPMVRSPKASQRCSTVSFFDGDGMKHFKRVCE